MENKFEVSLLLDFYGKLLTEKQYEILNLYINDDYSLSEISKEYNISRQGIYDNIKRGKIFLYEIESKLELLKKYTKKQDKIKEIIELIEKIDIKNVSQSTKKYLEKIKEEIFYIINND